MSAGLKIILYLVFVVVLFSVDSLVLLGSFSALLLLLLVSRLPFRYISRGWLPISVFLFFTFLSNLLFRHGKVLFIAGPFMITDLGLTEASVKTIRLLLMIGGAKLLTGTTPVESFTEALGKLLSPLQRAGIPVKDFVSTMGLTFQLLPALKERFLDIYRESVQQQSAHGFWNRVRVIAGFLLPLFVKSMNAPDEIIQQGKSRDTY